ncbi:hypothetical protein V6N13_082502 [Hibiscus sabdariffa]
MVSPFAASEQPIVHSSTDISSSFPLPIHNEQLQPVVNPTQEQPMVDNSSPPVPNAATTNGHDEHTEFVVIDSSLPVPNDATNGHDEHTYFVAIDSSSPVPITAISNGHDEHTGFTAIESHRPNLLNKVQPEHLEQPCDNLAPMFTKVAANDTSSLTDHDVLQSDHVTTISFVFSTRRFFNEEESKMNISKDRS